MLTIVYLTSRKEPRIQWFCQSLKRELKGDYSNVMVVVVSFHGTWIEANDTETVNFGDGLKVVFTNPKPTVWQGPHRLTSQDYFAASNARNTGLCLAPDGWIAYVDDLSLLMPHWLDRVKMAMDGNYIVCGSYQKVKELKVKDGELVTYTHFPEGMDGRLPYAKTDVSSCEAGWLFGCSLAGPVEAFLTVNGWPEICDGLGFEDCCMGVVLKNAGFELKFDRRMLTLESEEDHHIGPVFKKDDWHFKDGIPIRGGNGHDDKSHSVLNIAKQSKHFPNHFDIRELRKKVLAGEPFPVDVQPHHDFYTGIALKDL